MATTKRWAVGCVITLIATAVMTVGPIAQQDAGAQGTPTPLACWQFEGDFTATTNSAFDGVAGPQADGAGTNDATTTAANPSPAGGSSLSLDGAGDYLNVGNPLPVTGSYTKAMWVYRAAENADGSWENLYTSGDGGGAHALAIDPSQGNQLLAWHRGGTGPGLEAHNTGYTMPTGTWTHVAAVYDAVVDTFTTYANGTVVDTQTGVGTLGPMTNEDTIGSYAAMQSWLNGQMDDVCIYGTALSSADIAGLAMATTGEVCSFFTGGGAIADGSPLDGLRSTIQVDHAATIQSIEVVLQGAQHPSVGELTIIMFSPDPDLFVSVMNEPANGDDSNLGGDYTISDAGASLFDAATAAGPDDIIEPGSYRASRSDTDAEEFSEQFVGLSTAGTWSLETYDNIGGNVGSITGVEWKFTVSSGGCPTGGGTTLCNGQVVTIDMNLNGGLGVGTAGPDVILGTPGVDVIDGLGGADLICAGGGNDTVRGGDGADEIFGGDGDDRVWGFGGSDTLRGGEGDDLLKGGDDPDFLYGDGGDDSLTGDMGDDQMWGGLGRDRLWGFDGDDQLFGEAGIDTLQGMRGDDTLDGGADNDVLLGQDDADELHGGPGNDAVAGGNGDDVLDGGDGHDRVWGQGGSDTVRGGMGSDLVNGGGLGPNWLYGEDGHDRLVGGSGVDQAWGGPGTDRFWLGDGDDFGFGEAGQDRLFGQGGFDTCDGGPNPDISTTCEVLIDIP